jgi:large repetitive protein
MKIGVLLFLCMILSQLCFGQSCAVPIVVDFTKSADTTTVITGARSGSCCGDNNCISFTIKKNPLSDMINFNADQLTGASFYTIDCGPLIPIGTPACISGLTSFKISFCKPGSNPVNYTITAIKGISASADLKLRQACTGSMSVTGLQQASITWTSIYPGAAGAYNNYLSQTSGNNTISVTPQLGAPAYIDYKVSGTQSTICNLVRSDTIRVYIYAPLLASITPVSPLICSGNPVTLTASPTGGNPAYTYLWSNGATTASITVSVPGNYSVSVNDQIVSCGAVNAQTTVVAVTPVAPTAQPVSVCVGEKAVLNALTPGGPYQWYDASTSGNLLSSGSSYTTPVFNSTTTITYYLQTTNTGCESTRTAVTVTVTPNPVKPSITAPP